MGRILALDVGEKRIGIAVNDALNITAQGVAVINRADLEKLKEIVNEYAVEKIIVGLPLNMNGTKGEKAISIEEFVEFLKKEILLPIETIDERLTTLQGERILLEGDISRKKRKKYIDKIAAQLILQQYIDTICSKR